MHSFLPALSGILLLAGVHRPAEAPLVEIVRFDGARGTRLPGEVAASSLTLSKRTRANSSSSPVGRHSRGRSIR